MAEITTSDAQLVASLPKAQGRLMLANSLKWEKFDEEKDLKRAIHLDHLHGHLMFAVEKGFTWEQVVIVLKFADELLHQIKESTITDTLKYYKSKSDDLADNLGSRNYKIYTDFITGTILPHFKLFKLVTTCEREEQTPNLLLKVEPPVTPGPLKETKEIKIWEYEQQVEQIQRKECERTNERLVEKEKITSQTETEKKRALDNIKLPEGDGQLTKEALGDIIQGVLKAYSSAFTTNVRAGIEDLQEDLECKLEQTSLPRPQALGPPPRFAIKPKTPANQTKPKSPKVVEKPKSRGGSSRSGKGKTSKA